MLKLADKQGIKRILAYICSVMKVLKYSLFCLLLLSFGMATKPVPKLSFEQLESLCRKNNDTLYVVNYWATWCRPCIAEMPSFFDAAQKFKKQKVKIVFVSLNSVKEADKVQKFTEAKKNWTGRFYTQRRQPQCVDWQSWSKLGRFYSGHDYV